MADYPKCESCGADDVYARGHKNGCAKLKRLALESAAPDLLAACAKALDYLGRIEEASEGAELRDLLRAAIARATGEVR